MAKLITCVQWFVRAGVRANENSINLREIFREFPARHGYLRNPVGDRFRCRGGLRYAIGDMVGCDTLLFDSGRDTSLTLVMTSLMERMEPTASAVDSCMASIRARISRKEGRRKLPRSFVQTFELRESFLDKLTAVIALGVVLRVDLRMLIADAKSP